MKKRVITLLIAIFIGTLSTAGFSDKAALTAICPNNDYPFVYADKDGHAKGFLVDYLKAFSNFSGTPIEIRLADPKDLHLIFKESGDILFDANNHLDDFESIPTRPFMVLENALIVNVQDFSQTATISSSKRDQKLILGTKQNADRIALLNGSANPAANIVYYDNNTDGLKDLKLHKIDGYFMPINQALKLINEAQLKNLTVIKERNYSEAYAFEVKDKLLASELNAFITTFNKSDTYRAAYKEAFDTTYIQDFFKHYYIYIFNAVTMLILICVMLLAHYISKNQKQTIASKDKELGRQIENNKSLLDTVLSHEKILNDYYVNLSHEFRTPLNMILSVSQATEVLTKTMNTKKLVQNNASYNRIIKTNVFRMMKLINNITDLKKLDQNILVPKYEMLDLVYLMEDMIDQIHLYMDTMLVEITMTSTLPELIMSSDPVILKRIIANLISNAIKHGQNTTRIQIFIACADDRLILTVTDDGTGMDPDELEGIFESYAKIKNDSSLFYRQEGAGIGLTLVKRFVELMEGSIDLISALGAGTTVSISLPLSAPPHHLLSFEPTKSCGMLHSEQIIEIELSDIWKSELIS